MPPSCACCCSDQEGTAAGTGHLPLSLVKRIMCLDPDVSRVSAEGLKAVVAATEHFLQRLAVQAAEAASAAKRSTIKFSGWCSLARASPHCPCAPIVCSWQAFRVGYFAHASQVLNGSWLCSMMHALSLKNHVTHACVLSTLV